MSCGYPARGLGAGHEDEFGPLTVAVADSDTLTDGQFQRWPVGDLVSDLGQYRAHRLIMARRSRTGQTATSHERHVRGRLIAQPAADPEGDRCPAGSLKPFERIVLELSERPTVDEAAGGVVGFRSA